MRLPLPTVACECDRHGESDRCDASIISAVLQDVGIINEHDSSMMVDKNKVRRERVKARWQLSCMLSDERPNNRDLAFRRILAARKETASNSTTTVRQFPVPKLNFEAEDYTELVDWKSIDRCSPPVMKDMSETITFVECRVTDKVDYPRFPCHTQCTERCIKLVTQASVAMCGEERRDGFINARLHSRNIMK